MPPLNIGILGASKISIPAVVEPAHAAGHRLVLVAARDEVRASAYAQEHGVADTSATYADLVEDPRIDVVYNGLPNGLHAPWNLRALEAGKHVLSEKPSAANSIEAQAVRDSAESSDLVFMEAFHYYFHPVFRRVLALLEAGRIGEVQRVVAPMRTRGIGEGDHRWELSLAGGAYMDVGCYGLHAARMIGRFCGGEPVVRHSTMTEREGHPGVDETATVELVYPNGAVAEANADMGGQDLDFSLTVIGERGRIWVDNFVGPMNSTDTIRVAVDGEGDIEEHPGMTPTYHYQLEAFRNAVREGRHPGLDADDALAQARLIDEVYRAAGYPERPSTTL